MNLMLTPQAPPSTDLKSARIDATAIAAIEGDDTASSDGSTAFVAMVDGQVLSDQQPELSAFGLTATEREASELLAITDQDPELTAADVQKTSAVKLMTATGENEQLRPALPQEMPKGGDTRSEIKVMGGSLDAVPSLRRGPFETERAALLAERSAVAATSLRTSPAQTVVQGQINAQQVVARLLPLSSENDQADVPFTPRTIPSGAVVAAAMPNRMPQLPLVAANSEGTAKPDNTVLPQKEVSVQLPPASAGSEDAPQIRNVTGLQLRPNNADAATQPTQVAALVEAKTEHTRFVVAEAENAPLSPISERLTPGQTTTPLQPRSTPETARQVAHQIAHAVSQGTTKMTEIALNPEELGRVRLSLSAGDGAVSLVILAERPETQDLMRRHIESLAQEFRDLGYEDISFSFGADGQSEEMAENDNAQPEHETLTNTPNNVDPVAAAAPSGGLDLRL